MDFPTRIGTKISSLLWLQVYVLGPVIGGQQVATSPIVQAFSVSMTHFAIHCQGDTSVGVGA